MGWTLADVALTAWTFSDLAAAGFVETASLVRKRPVYRSPRGYHGAGAWNLDWQVCSRARLSRDARFDGKFFIAVLTSKVYCRSICPAPNRQREECPLLSQRGRRGGGGFSSLLALPAGMLARNSGLAGNAQTRFRELCG